MWRAGSWTRRGERRSTGTGAGDRPVPGAVGSVAVVSWLSWVVIGFIAGALAKAVTRRSTPGCLGTIVIGIVGGLLGGALFKAAGDEGINEFSVRSVLIAFVGAAVLLVVSDQLSGRGQRRRR